MKLSLEDKITICEERRRGVATAVLSKKYEVRESVIKYLIRLVDKHGYSVLRGTRNEVHSKEYKERVINRVLLGGKSILSVAIDEGLLSQGMLSNWISNYKKNGYNVIEKKRGRSSMTKKPVNKPKKPLSEVEQLKQENLYLRAELEYLKKLEAVVDSRKKQERKRK